MRLKFRFDLGEALCETELILISQEQIRHRINSGDEIVALLLRSVLRSYRGDRRNITGWAETGEAPPDAAAPTGMCMTITTGTGKSAGSCGIIYFNACGPPVDMPITTMSINPARGIFNGAAAGAFCRR